MTKTVGSRRISSRKRLVERLGVGHASGVRRAVGLALVVGVAQSGCGPCAAHRSCVDVRPSSWSGVGSGLLLGELDGVFDLRLRCCCSSARRSRPMAARRGRAGSLLDALDRVLLAPALDLFLRRGSSAGRRRGGRGSGRSCTPVSSGPRRAARARRLAGGCVDGEHVHAVDRRRPGCRSPPRGRRVAAGDAPVRRGPTWRTGCSRRRRRPAASRSRPGSSTRAGCPGSSAPSPKKQTATRPVLLQLGGQRGAGREAHAAADDAVGAEHVLVHVGDVHAAALAAAVAGRLAEQLGHHPLGSPPLAMQWPWPRWVLVM